MQSSINQNQNPQNPQNPEKGNTAVVCLSPYSGGMEMDAIKLACLLSTKVNIVLVAKTNHYIANYHKNHLQSTVIKLETIGFKSSFSFYIIRNTKKILKEHNIKNVIFFGASELRSLYFAFMGRKLNVLIRHGTTKTRPKKDLLHRLIYSCVNYHVAICEHLANNVKYIIPFGGHTQLKVIYPSLRHPPSLLNEARRNEIVRLLHVGRIADGKGQKEAVEACAALYDSKISFELLCVGEIDPNYEQRFKQYVDSKPYASLVKFTGYTDNVAGYFQNAQIFVFPSKGEGLSNAFIEALSYGLICVCYENTSFPELRNLGFNFFAAKDQDIPDLKKNLLKAVREVKYKNLPMRKQSELAVRIFDKNRERNEFLNLLQ